MQSFDQPWGGSDKPWNGGTWGYGFGAASPKGASIAGRNWFRNSANRPGSATSLGGLTDDERTQKGYYSGQGAYFDLFEQARNNFGGIRHYTPEQHNEESIRRNNQLYQSISDLSNPDIW